MLDILVQTGWLAAGVGYILIFGIGVLLFSFAILRTSVVPKWIGWLGLINVAVHAVLLTVLSGVFAKPPTACENQQEAAQFDVLTASRRPSSRPRSAR